MSQNLWRHCPKCGNDLRSGFIVCPHCGLPLTTAAYDAQRPQQPQIIKVVQPNLFGSFLSGLSGCATGCLILGAIALYGFISCVHTITENMDKQSTPAQPRVGSTTGSIRNWRTVDRLEGFSEKNTATFNIPTDQWRLRWQASGVDGNRSLYFSIKVRESDGSAVGLVANVSESGGDATYLRGPGNYYLEISSINARYAIEIDLPSP